MEMAETMVACFGSGALRTQADDDLSDLFQSISRKEISEFERLLRSQDNESESNSSSSFLSSESHTSAMDCSLTVLQPIVNSPSSAQISATSNSPINLAQVPSEYFNMREMAAHKSSKTHGTTELAAGAFSTPLMSSQGSRVRTHISLPRAAPNSPLKPSSIQLSAFEVPTKQKRRHGPRTSHSTVPSLAESLCPVCEAPTTGRHYGIHCCTGCKSFFRRSIRSNSKYQCKSKGKCSTKRGRIWCRSCRLQKCFAVGMNKNYVQNERDKISPKFRREVSEEYCDVDFSEQVQAVTKEPEDRTTANLADVANYSSLLTPKILCWAKNIPGFDQFSEEDQSALISRHRDLFLVLEIATRSFSNQSALLMGDKHVIGLGASAPTYPLGDSISREILTSLRRLKLDEMEFTLLKSILFFDATSPWVADKSLLQKLQTECFVSLQQHVASKHPKTLYRFWNIFSLIDAFNLTALELSFMLRDAGLRPDLLL